MFMRIAAGLMTAAVSCMAAEAQPPRAALRQQGQQERARAMPLYKLGLEELRGEQWEKAASLFERTIKIDPSFEMAHYALGRALMPQKKYGEATAALTMCRDLYRAQAGRRFSGQQEAQQYWRDRLTQLDELIRQGQQAPQSARAVDALRQLMENRRQIQENLTRGSDVSMDTSVPAFVSMALGSAYFRLGRLADAEREYKATIVADAKTGEAYSNLAVVYLQTGRFEEAEKAVKSAEKTGFKVNPMLKDDIEARKK